MAHTEAHGGATGKVPTHKSEETENDQASGHEEASDMQSMWTARRRWRQGWTATRTSRTDATMRRARDQSQSWRWGVRQPHAPLDLPVASWRTAPGRLDEGIGRSDTVPARYLAPQQVSALLRGLRAPTCPSDVAAALTADALDPLKRGTESSVITPANEFDGSTGATVLSTRKAEAEKPLMFR